MSNKRKIFICFIVIILGALAFLSYYSFVYTAPQVNKGLVKEHLTISAHHDIVNGIRFSNDSVIVSAAVDSQIILSSVIDGKRIRTIKAPAGITSLDIYNDIAVVGCYDAVTRIYNLANGSLLRELKGHNGTVWSIAISNDGRYIATAGEDKLVRLWDAVTGTQLKTFSGHTLNIWSVKFSPDDTQIVSAGFDQSFRIWNITSGKAVMINAVHSEAIVDIAFNHAGTVLATASDDKTLRLWQYPSGKFIRMMEMPEHVQSVVFSPDDKYILAGGRDKPMAGEVFQNFFGDSEVSKGTSARLFDAATGELLHTFSLHRNDVNDVAFSPDGRMLATASADHMVKVFKLVSR